LLGSLVHPLGVVQPFSAFHPLASCAILSAVSRSSMCDAICFSGVSHNPGNFQPDN
jgi:hypothetical protein